MSKPLYQKLGIKNGFKCAAIGYEGAYSLLIGSDIKVNLFYDYNEIIDDGYHFMHVFTNDVQYLESSMKAINKMIVMDGFIWYSWYKKSSKKQQSVNEDTIRNTALALNLVDTKVCSIDKDWSALKLVIPLKFRK